MIRPDVDADGVDLVLEAAGQIRHVQLKTRWREASGPRVLPINSRLYGHPDACVVWTFWQVDPDCSVRLEYKYSERMSSSSSMPTWPPPLGDEPAFELRWRHFLPDYLEIGELASHLFGPMTP